MDIIKRYKGIRELQEALTKAGLPHSRQWLWKLRHNGILVLPKSAVSDNYAITDEQIAEIVEALAPDGSRYWRP